MFAVSSAAPVSANGDSAGVFGGIGLLVASPQPHPRLSVSVTHLFDVCGAHFGCTRVCEWQRSWQFEGHRLARLGCCLAGGPGIRVGADEVLCTIAVV